MLNFYLVTIKHLTGNLHADRDAFEKAVNHAAGNEKELLRSASRRLSAHADGPLAAALKQFDFDILQQWPMPFGNFDSPFQNGTHEGVPHQQGFNPGILSKIIDDIIEENLLPMDPFINELEDLMDSMNLRGAPARQIRRIRDKMKRIDPDSWPFDHLALELTDAQAKNLSREAYEFIFG